ncbi:MAG: glycosyltransferase family 2 protein, partial [Candidatus Latescibacterota bacterium]
MNVKDVSVIVTSFNEQTNISRCLEGVKDFGEIILVDSFSTDDTLDIARSYPAVIYSRAYRSAAKQKNWALDRARNRWVLVLDADEALSENLRLEIERLDIEDGCSGFWIRRESHYLDGPIRHCGWQRDKVLRLFDRAQGRYEEREVHEEVTLEGKVATLNGKLEHFPYWRIEQHLDKIEEYTTRGAVDYVERGGRLAVVNMILHPPFRFLRMYVMQRGFLDGRRGFILCLLSS